jgi:hypothetical protein
MTDETDSSVSFKDVFIGLGLIALFIVFFAVLILFAIKDSPDAPDLPMVGIIHLTKTPIPPTQDPFVFVKVAKVWSETTSNPPGHYFVSTDGVGYSVFSATDWGVLEVGNCYKVEQIHGYLYATIGRVIKVSCAQ